MYRSIEEFLADWKAESENTRKILGALTDASLVQQASPGSRTLGRLAWHVVTAIPEMAQRTGLPVRGPGEHETVPTTAASIAAAYIATAESLTDELRAHWTDASLEITNDMYGEQWSNAMTLNVLLRHEIHHRAQMTMLMRLAGGPVPGVYGPSKEEWAQMGMPAQE